ncbi:MAG TPA: PEP-CTERM sorting domain-containing protein [Fimbriimonas sp.]|nr:PEP-CTERM sorting domain-containing protein [Fimbriimonas sp.]
MNKKLITIAALMGVAAASQSQVWYGGDFDGVNGYISNIGPNSFGFQGMVYDDFTWNSSSNADNILGSMFVGNVADDQLLWEIRQGVVSGTGTLGTLVASGTTTASYTFLMTEFGLNLYNMTASIASTPLVNGNTYHLGVALITTDINSSVGAVATTDGTNGIGSPLLNGNAFQWNASSNEVVGLSEDLSLGIGAAAVPEPASMIALGLGAAALLRRRRK